MDDDLKRRITGYHSPMDVGKEWERLEKKRKEKKRKYVLFWILLLGGSGAITALWLHDNSSTNEAQRILNKSGYATSTAKMTSEEECPKSAYEPIVQTTIEQISNQKKPTNQFPGLQNTIKQKNQEVNQADHISSLSQTAKVIGQNHQKVEISNALASNESDKQVQTKQGVAEDFKTEYRDLDDISPIPSLKTNVLLKETYELNEINPAISLAPPQKLRFIFEVSGLHSGKIPISDVWAQEFKIPHLNMSSSSFSTSLGMGKSVGDHFFITGGIFYNQIIDHLKANYEFTENVILPGQLVRISYLENGDYIETYDNAQAQVTRRLNLDVRNQFHTSGLQVGVSYPFGRRLELGAHLKVPVYQNYSLVSLSEDLKPIEMNGNNWFGTNGLQTDLGASYHFWSLHGLRLYFEAGITHQQRELIFGGAERSTAQWMPRIGFQLRR